MGMTLTEKILAKAAGKGSVAPGDVVFAKVDKLMMHDVSGPGVIKVLEEWERRVTIWNGSGTLIRYGLQRIILCQQSDKISASNIINLSNWTKKFGIKKHFKYGLGQYGICHTLSHEEALVLPGEVYVGGDSHTNTTGALAGLRRGLGHSDIAYVLHYGQSGSRYQRRFFSNYTVSCQVM